MQLKNRFKLPVLLLVGAITLTSCAAKQSVDKNSDKNSYTTSSSSSSNLKNANENSKKKTEVKNLIDNWFSSLDKAFKNKDFDAYNNLVLENLKLDPTSSSKKSEFLLTDVKNFSIISYDTHAAEQHPEDSLIYVPVEYVIEIGDNSISNKYKPGKNNMKETFIFIKADGKLKLKDRK